MLLESFAPMSNGGVTIDRVRTTREVSEHATIALFAMALLSMFGLGMMRGRVEL